MSNTASIRRVAALSLLLVGCLATPWSMSAADTRRPNILFILSDDHGVEEMGAYGNEVINTPNLDQLADQGMLFSRAYTPEAICSPARSSAYTGLYPLRHGAHRNHSQVFPETRSLAHYLLPLGYRVALAGKTHIGPPEAFPFEYLPGSGNTINQSETRIAGYFDDMVGLFAGAQQPFLLVVATSLPHTRLGMEGGYPAPEQYDPAEIPLPPYLVDTAETREKRTGYYELVTDLDDDIGTILRLLAESPARDNTLVVYASDHGAGFAFEKWTNYEAGIRIPMIVRWPGVVAPGSATDALVSLVDLLPTFVELAGGDVPGDLDGRSLLPVLTGASDRHHEMIYASHTTLGIRNASDPFPVRAVRDERYKYIRNLNPGGVFTNNVTERGQGGWNSWLALADSDDFAAQQVHRYQHRPAEELYDLHRDPYEMNNLAQDDSLRKTRETLSHALDQWMAQQGDKGLGAASTPSNVGWRLILDSLIETFKSWWNDLFG